MTRLVLAVYTCAVFALVPFALVHLWWRGRRQPGYRRHVGERFGRYAIASGGPLIWIHAVSVGETRAAQPLVKALCERFPEHRILLTHTTPTGRETSEQLFGDRVLRAYLPYDLPFAVRSFLQHFRPGVGILMETELWPNLVRGAAAGGVPIHLVNARMSARSERGYRRVGRLTRMTLGLLSGVDAQTASDAERLASLGAGDVAVTGNLKFDIEPPASARELALRFRARFGRGRPVFVAASTREGEEALLLGMLQGPELGDALVVIVPRHPQRFGEVALLLEGAGIPYVRRSCDGAVPAGVRVVLGDSMGELFAYYGAADLAFVGGSLLPLGGQNLIEACAMGVPVLVGPHTFNFAEATELACRSGAAVRVDGPAALAREAARLLDDGEARSRMAAAALEFAAGHRGATGRVVRRIESSLLRAR